MIVQTRPHLQTLAAELAAAGVPVPNGLGCYGLPDGNGVNVHTYGVGGIIADLPVAARAVLNAHVPPEPETPPTEILLALLADVTDVDETKPIIEAMLLILGGQP